MAGQNGTDILVQMEGATPGTYVTIAGQRDVTITESNDEVDVSSKDARHKRVLSGRYSSSVSCDHLYVSPEGAVEAKILTQLRAGAMVLLKRLETPAAGGAAVSRGTATAMVASWELSAPDQEEAIVSAEFTVDGAWA